MLNFKKSEIIEKGSIYPKRAKKRHQKSNLYKSVELSKNIYFILQTKSKSFRQLLYY